MTDLPAPSTPTETRRPAPSPAPLALGVAALVIALVALGIAITGAGSGGGDEPATDGASTEERVDADLFRGPDDLPALIDEVGRSVVDVSCGDGGGTGFAMDIEVEDPSGPFSTVIVTNHHVIDECLGGAAPLAIFVGDELAEAPNARIRNSDSDNDLALIEIDLEVTPIKVADTFAEPGWWSMVIGNPYDPDFEEILYNFVSIGHIGYVLDETWNYTTATINKGNSGGPLVNARGELIGITTYASASTEEGVWNIAVDSAALCAKLIDCGS